MGQLTNTARSLPPPAATPTPTPPRPAAAAPAPASSAMSLANARSLAENKYASQIQQQQNYAQQQQQAAAAAAAEQARLAALPRYVDFATGRTMISPDEIAIQRAIDEANERAKSRSSGGVDKYGRPKSPPPRHPKYGGAPSPRPPPMSYAQQLAEWNRNKQVSDYYTSELDYRRRLTEATYNARMGLPVLEDLGTYVQQQNLQVPTLYDPIHSPAWQRAMGQYLKDLSSFRGSLFNPVYTLPDSVGTAPTRPEGLTDEQWRQYTQGNYNAANFALLSRLGGSSAYPGQYSNSKLAALASGDMNQSMVQSRMTPRTFERPNFRVTNYTNPLTDTNMMGGSPIIDALYRANNPDFASPKLKQQYQQLMSEADDIRNAITNPFSVFVYGHKLSKDYVPPVRHQTIGPGGVKFGGEPGAQALGATNGNPIPKGVEGAGLWAYGVDPRDPKSLYFAWDYAKNHMGPKGAFREYAQYLWPVSESGGAVSFGPDAYYRKILNPNVATELLKKVDWHIRDTARKIDKSNAFMDSTIGQLLGTALTAWAGSVNPWMGALFGAATGSQRGGGSFLGALTGGISGGLGGVFSKFSPITSLSDVLPSYVAIRPGMEQSFFGKVGNWVTNKITSLPSATYDKFLGPNSYLTYADLGQRAFFDQLQNELRKNNVPVQVSVDLNGSPTLVPNTNSPEYQQYLANNAAQETAPTQGAKAGGLMSLRGEHGINRGRAAHR